MDNNYEHIANGNLQEEPEGVNPENEQPAEIPFGNDDRLAEESDALSELQAQYSELNDNFLRLNADFDNYRKRTVKEKADIIRSGGERVLIGIIPLIDDFERALETIKTSSDNMALVDGVELIYGKFIAFLNQNGVKEIETQNQPFDPERFEAVTTVPVEDPGQKGTIVDCLQKGYELNDKILRFPKVIVGE